MSPKILFEGWLEIPHSYAIVNCSQLIALSDIELSVSEKKYYNPSWTANDFSIWPTEHQKKLKSIKERSINNPDIIYRITYPYEINSNEKKDKKIIVFYTSEFSMLDTTYFTVNGRRFNEKDLISYILNNKNIYFVAPSIWSARGLERFMRSSDFVVNGPRNKVITHGVDTSIFRPKKNLKNVNDDKKMETETSNKIEPYDTELVSLVDPDLETPSITLVNIGAMTGNKGLMFLIHALIYLVQNGFKVKLILKGINDLYNSEQIIKQMLKDIIEMNETNKDLINHVLKNHVIFIFETLNFNDLADLYNKADLYVSPYIAEGFNLGPLEALACGVPVMVPETGSTEDYINDIEKIAPEYIWKIKSSVICQDGRYSNNIDFNSLYGRLINFCANFCAIFSKKNDPNDPKKLLKHIEENYSWNKVAEDMKKNLFDM